MPDKTFAWCGVFLFVWMRHCLTNDTFNANPGVDMYNVDNPVNTAGYLGVTVAG